MSLTASSRPGLRARVLLRFPAALLAGAGIKWAFSKGQATASLDYPSLVDRTSIPDASRHTVAAYNRDSLAYEEIRLDTILGSVVGDGYRGQGDVTGAPAAILNTDRTVGLTAALTVARSWPLCAANSVPAGREIVVKDMVAGISAVNTLTITTTGADTFANGSGSLVLSSPGAGVVLRSDGASKWAIVAASSPGLTAIGTLTPAADKLAYFTGAATAALTALTAGGRALAGLTGEAADKIGYFTGAGAAALASFTAAGRALVGLTGEAADKMAYFTGAGAAALTSISAFGRSLIAAADAATSRAVSLSASYSADHGQCRLVYVSTTGIRLDRFNGQWIIINGVPCLIPSGGVSRDNTGLAAATLYYVYAYMNAGTMALELSTTGHTRHTDGVEIKTGDATRTLVGMVYGDTGGVFADTTAKRFVASFFNRRQVSLIGGNTGVSGTSTTYVELTTTARAQFICWSDEATLIGIDGYYRNTIAANDINVGLAFDGTVLDENVCTMPGANYACNPMVATVITAGEGFHYVTPFGKQTGGTTSYFVICRGMARL